MAAAALGQIGTEEVIHHLAKALNDPDELVRYNAAKALGQIAAQP